MPRGILVGLALTAQACCVASPAPTTSGSCGPEVLDAGAAQVAAAIAGAANCSSDSDCVLVATPCGVIEGSCAAPFAAVRRDHEAAVEHAFSIAGAETCAACPVSTGGTPVVCADGSTPAAACLHSACATVDSNTDAGGSGLGAFEWSCGGGCDSQSYCDVEDVTTPCPGWSGNVLVADGGICASATAVGTGGSCSADVDCGLGGYCQGAQTCATGCPQGPPNCGSGCVLQAGNHGCPLCLCATACPAAPDAG